MITSSHKIRFVKAIGLVVALTAILAPSAQAGVKSDAVDRYVANNPSVDVRSPDRKHPARQWAHADAVERALVNSARLNPDAIERYLVNTDSTSQPVFRSGPDTRDAIAGRFPTTSPVLVSSPSGSGFDWGDAGLGAGMALGLMLLLLGTRQFVHRKSETAAGSGAALSS